MGLLERAKNICLTPRNEWTVIAAEAAAPGPLLKGYVLPLAGVAALAGLIGGSLIGHSLPFIGTFRVPIVTGIGLAIYRVVMAVVSVYLLSLIINALAPTFGGQKDPVQALKVAVYSYTPAWVASVVAILPMLGLLALLGALYGLYLLYLGLPALMKNPPEKSAGYAAVVVACAIVLALVVGAVSGRFTASAMGGASGLSAVHFDKGSPGGKLEEVARRMEEAGRKMEAAKATGNSQEQLKVAMEGLGAAIGGGKRYDPLGIEQLKPFVPDTLRGLPRTSSKAEKSGIAGLMVSKAQAAYGDGAGKSIDLEISDTGGASGILGLAGWAGLQGEKEDDAGVERTAREGGRLVHEKVSKRGGANEYSIVLGDRFVVSARGQGVAIDELKQAVSSLDLPKLEGMREVGVQK